MRVALLAILALAALGTALSLHRQWLVVPPEWAPWVPLDLTAPPNFLTRYKLSRLSGDTELCQNILATAELSYERLTDRQTGESCGLYNAVRIDRTTAEVGKSFSLTCRAAVSLAMWEKHVLQPAARKHFGSEVAQLEHFGSYSCRNVYNRPNATRSQHATAEAFDVAGFILADGRRIRVLRDWPRERNDTPADSQQRSDPSGPTAESQFLREVRTGACQFFDGVLSPDYNAAHRDHFHFDRGPYRVCR
jgi:hypothetical protein